jgi:hypothetical protein
MKRLLILIFSAFIIINPGFSQQGSNDDLKILFHGLVMDASSMLPISKSQILINRNFSSVTGSDGAFSFYVNRNDTILFQSLGYKPATMYITDTLSGREFIAGIFLNSDTLHIGEVVIIPRLSNLRSEIMNAQSRTPAFMENAKYNVAVSAYQGRNSQGSLGDPSANYDQLRQKQKVDAFEKGGIPSDKILGLSPLLLVPAAYMLIKGVPEKPASFKRQITDQELDQIQKMYLESLKRRK